MTCALCLKADPVPFTSTKRRCAFDGGAFTHDNWMCETAGALRDLALPKTWAGDQWAFVVPMHEDADDEASHIVVSGYKHRGGTEGIWALYDDKPPEPATEAQALWAVKAAS